MTPALWITIGIAWILAFWLYRDYSVDKFRQEMFALRDHMFDAADQGDIPMDHPAYRMLRSAMNGYIRFGHRLNLLTIMIFVLSLDEDEKQWAKDHGFAASWEKATGDLAPRKRNQLETYRRRMDVLVAKQLVYGSPALTFSIVPAALLTALIRFHLRIARDLKRFWRRHGGDQIDRAALAMGESA